MQKGEITLDEMIEQFSQTMGREKATSLIEEAFSKAGLPKKESYSLEEVLKMCELLKTDENRFVRTITMCFMTAIKIKKTTF